MRRRLLLPLVVALLLVGCATTGGPKGDADLNMRTVADIRTPDDLRLALWQAAGIRAGIRDTLADLYVSGTIGTEWVAEFDQYDREYRRLFHLVASLADLWKYSASGTPPPELATEYEHLRQAVASLNAYLQFRLRGFRSEGTEVPW